MKIAECLEGEGVGAPSPQRVPPGLSAASAASIGAFTSQASTGAPPPQAASLGAAVQLVAGSSMCKWVRAVPRWVLEARAGVSTFLRLAMIPSTRTTPSTCLWPIPPPYSFGMPSRCHDPRRRRRRSRAYARKLLVNLAVVALSYLAGGSRAFCPQAGRAGCPPSAEQQYIVRNIEESLMQWRPRICF